YAISNAPAEFVMARLPAGLKHKPFGASNVGVSPSVAGLMTVLGNAGPVLVRFALVYSTTVNGGLALFDHRLPAASNARAQGAMMEFWPSSLSTTSGINAEVVAVAGTAGRFAASNLRMVVPAPVVLAVPVAVVISTPPLLATHRSPALSSAIPRGPLKAFDTRVTAGVSVLVPVIASCVALKTATRLLLWSDTHWLPLESNTDCWGKFSASERMTAVGMGAGVVASAASW